MAYPTLAYRLLARAGNYSGAGSLWERLNDRGTLPIWPLVVLRLRAAVSSGRHGTGRQAVENFAPIRGIVIPPCASFGP